jgi:ABC-type phosphate transport system auxiliary subunit
MSKFKGLDVLKQESEPRQSVKSPRLIGKRQNPAYQQISAYVRRDLYDSIRRELVGQSQDFSDLLESWMQDWVTRNRR